MKRYLPIATALLVVLTMLSSCHYKDLCYDHNHSTEHNLDLRLALKLDIDIDIDVDVSEKDHTKIKLPSLMVVCFYDTLTGAQRNRSYVGPEGGDLHVDPGVYDMMVYSFDTEWTWVRGEGHIDSLEAYTSDITDVKSPLLMQAAGKDAVAPGPIIYTPDHLLVTRKRVEIPEYSLEKQEITIEATASTVVETYSFKVKKIKGIEHVSSVEAFITNQARSTFFGRGEVSTEAATIYFPMEIDKRGKVFKCTFNTFGKLPGESKSYLNVVITDSKGKPHTLVTDITDQFENENHNIVIEDSVVIPPPETVGGGIAPTVEDWEEENHDVAIG